MKDTRGMWKLPDPSILEWSELYRDCIDSAFKIYVFFIYPLAHSFQLFKITYCLWVQGKEKI